MAKFVLICGPQAVGKMTVGQELTKITDLKLLHNHMTIEPLLKIFKYKSKEFQELNDLFRTQIFEEFSKSDQYGLIFTCCYDFDAEEEKEILEKWINLFKQNSGECYFIELEADLEERLKRNKTENRLENKPSKKNIEWSEKNLLKSVEKHRFNSYQNEVKFENYLKINNTNISAKNVAKIIKDKFEL